MNAYQQAKVERSLVHLRYLASICQEVQEYSKKHLRDTLTVCTKKLIEELAAGKLLYLIVGKKKNGTPEYEAIPFERAIGLLTADLLEELKLMGGNDAA